MQDCGVSAILGVMTEPDRHRMTLRFPPEVIDKLEQLAERAQAESGRRPSHNEVIQNLIADAAEVPHLAAASRPRDISVQHAINAIRVRAGAAGSEERGDVGAMKLIARELTRHGQDRAGAVVFAVAASLVLKENGPTAAADELLHTARSLRVQDAVDGPIGDNVELRIALAEYALELDPGNATCRSVLAQWKLWAGQVERRTGGNERRAHKLFDEVIQLLEWSDPVLGEITVFDSYAGYALAIAQLEVATIQKIGTDAALHGVAAALGRWAVNCPRDRASEERGRWIRQVRFLYHHPDAGDVVIGLLEAVRRRAPWDPVAISEINGI